MGGIRKEVEEPFSAPPWIVTFSDMIGLLTSFFIMLLTFSTKDKKKFRRLHGALLGEFGLIAEPGCPDYDSFLEPAEALVNDARNDGLRRQRKDLEKLDEGAKILVQTGGLGDRVQFDRLESGLRLRILVEGTFADGSFRLSDATRRALGEIADLLRLHPCKATVVGHAFAEGGAAEDGAVALSELRAREAALYLSRTGRVPTSRLGIAARGDHEPIVANAVTGSEIERNRRVEILILADA